MRPVILFPVIIVPVIVLPPVIAHGLRYDHTIGQLRRREILRLRRQLRRHAVQLHMIITVAFRDLHQQLMRLGLTDGLHDDIDGTEHHQEHTHEDGHGNDHKMHLHPEDHIRFRFLEPTHPTPRLPGNSRHLLPS